MVDLRVGMLYAKPCGVARWGIRTHYLADVTTLEQPATGEKLPEKMNRHLLKAQGANLGTARRARLVGGTCRPSGGELQC